MNGTLMIGWLDEVWKERLLHDPDPSQSLLIMAASQCHTTARVKSKLKTLSKVAVARGGLTKYCKPLDVSINEPFKDYLRRLWEEWMADENAAKYTTAGRRMRMSYAEVASMVNVAFDAVFSETIEKGFNAALFPESKGTDLSARDGEEEEATSEDEQGTEEEEQQANAVGKTIYR